MRKVLQEASLNRVWQHFNSDRPFAIVTAFRGEYSRDENVQRNKELAATVRNMGYGFFYLDGFWVENEGTDKEQHVSEDSLFIIGKEGQDDIFVRDMVHLGKEYDQDGVLVKTIDGVKIYDKNGNPMFDIGNFTPNKAGEAYSKLRHGKGTFIFESERDDIGFIQRLAGIK